MTGQSTEEEEGKQRAEDEQQQYGELQLTGEAVVGQFTPGGVFFASARTITIISAIFQCIFAAAVALTVRPAPVTLLRLVTGHPCAIGFT